MRWSRALPGMMNRWAALSEIWLVSISYGLHQSVEPETVYWLTDQGQVGRNSWPFYCPDARAKTIRRPLT